MVESVSEKAGTFALTNEQEKDIGIVTRLLEAVSKHALAIIVIAPSVLMAFQQKIVPDWLILASGTVLAQYFPKLPGTP